jgi:hypothetical protein
MFQVFKIGVKAAGQASVGLRSEAVAQGPLHDQPRIPSKTKIKFSLEIKNILNSLHRNSVTLVP